MLAKTLVVFYVWSPDIFVLIVIITLFQALFILLCQIKHYHTIPYNKHCITSGVSRISFRGGVQKLSGKLGVFNAWRSHAFVRGVRGHAPPRKFLKMVQFGAF